MSQWPLNGPSPQWTVEVPSLTTSWRWESPARASGIASTPRPSPISPTPSNASRRRLSTSSESPLRTKPDPDNPHQHALVAMVTTDIFHIILFIGDTICNEAMQNIHFLENKITFFVSSKFDKLDTYLEARKNDQLCIPPQVLYKILGMNFSWLFWWYLSKMISAQMVF